MTTQSQLTTKQLRSFLYDDLKTKIKDDRDIIKKMSKANLLDEIKKTNKIELIDEMKAHIKKNTDKVLLTQSEPTPKKEKKIKVIPDKPDGEIDLKKVPKPRGKVKAKEPKEKPDPPSTLKFD